MPYGLQRWKHGGVEYPLTSATTNSLLRDADPAVYYALDLFATVIREYVGDRLLAQAALEGLRFPSAVERTLHFEPSPFLQAHDMVFPVLALYRTEEGWDQHTVSFEKDTSTWTWCYVLPPLTPRQIEQLNPILRSVAVVMSTFGMQSFDPSWEAGATLRDKSGIQKMIAGPVRYLDIEMLDGGQDQWWRAVSGKLIVQERSALVTDALDTFEGANVTLDMDPTESGGNVVEEFVEARSYPAPVITAILPDSGSKVGSVPFTVQGTGFRPGTPAKVLIGGSYASSVVVASPFAVTGLTPEHEASPTYAADVQVIDADGNASNVLDGAYTFTTP